MPKAPKEPGKDCGLGVYESVIRLGGHDASEVPRKRWY